MDCLSINVNAFCLCFSLKPRLFLDTSVILFERHTLTLTQDVYILCSPNYVVSTVGAYLLEPGFIC